MSYKSSRKFDLSDYANMSWKVTTAPAVEPVTVAEIKTYARIDTTDEDTLIGRFITAVREATELFLGRALITQTIIASLSTLGYQRGYGLIHDGSVGNYGIGQGYSYGYRYGTDGEVITLPRPPLIDVIEVRTVDEDGTETEYSSENYYIRTNPEPGELVIRYGKSPPINTDRFHGGYEIEYTAGYGPAATDVPEAIKLGIQLWVSEIYENRVPTINPPALVKSLMMPYRMINI